MAHFAQLDENNEVIQVIVVNNNDILDQNGEESEEIGIQFCKTLLGQDTNWAQTSYNANFRKRYAGIGFSFDSVLDAFIPPKPFNSWLLDTESASWYPPVPKPTGDYVWDEASTNWVISPAPYPSWVLDENNQWTAPTPMPDDGKPYYWNEEQVSWVEYTQA